MLKTKNDIIHKQTHTICHVKLYPLSSLEQALSHKQKGTNTLLQFQFDIYANHETHLCDTLR